MKAESCVNVAVMWNPVLYYVDGQEGRDQPVTEHAVAVTSDAVDNRYTGRFNAAPQVILS